MRTLALMFTFTALALPTSSPAQMTDAQLKQTVERRIVGDRTGACVAVAVIDASRVARSVVCADAAKARKLGFDTAFEIGSISKTMTATLVADLIERGEWKLTDPLAKYLPPNAKLPTRNGREITIADIVTHTSGLPALPARMRPARADNPYGALTESELLDSLGDVALTRDIGSEFAYSNFAMMLLSHALARHAGKDFEALLTQTLLTPLGMRSTFIARQPASVTLAQGHLPNGNVTANWTFPANTAGVGGVRSTLDDMVKYVQANLGVTKTPLAAAIARTHEPLREAQGARVAMNWLVRLMPAGAVDTSGSGAAEKMLREHGADPAKGAAPAVSTVYSHGGGTGGFSALVAFDKHLRKGVVALADTALTSIGGLDDLALPLLYERLPLGKPRVAATPDKALLEALAGNYDLRGLPMRVWAEGGKLFVQARGQPAFEMGYDSAGEFYPREFDALLKPTRDAAGKVSGFLWVQGGAAVAPKRVEGEAGK